MHDRLSLQRDTKIRLNCAMLLVARNFRRSKEIGLHHVAKHLWLFRREDFSSRTCIILMFYSRRAFFIDQMALERLLFDAQCRQTKAAGSMFVHLKKSEQASTLNCLRSANAT